MTTSAQYGQIPSPEAASPAAENGAPRPPHPNHVRRYIRKKVARSMPRIIGKFVEQAGEGSVQHLAALAKLGGFDHRPEPPVKKRRGKSYTQALLEQLEEHEARMLGQNEARRAAEQAKTESAN